MNERLSLNLLTTLEGHTFRVDCLSAKSVIIDLGMNHGSFSRGIHELTGAKTFGLEPVPDLFQLLRGAEYINRIEPWALTATNGQIDISVHTSVCASIFQYKDVVSQIRVDSVNLQTLLEKWGLEEVDLIKIDIEGAEFDALLQAPDEVLNRFKQITIEFHDFIWPDRETDVNSIISRLKSLGFQQLSFALTNGDVLFLSRDLHLQRASRLRHILRHKYLPGSMRLIRRRLGEINPRFYKSDNSFS